MVLPLIVIGLIVLGVFLLIFFVAKILKIILIVGALVWIFGILKKHSKIKNLANWEYFVIVISVGVGIIAIGSHFGFLSVGALPMAIQEPIVQSSLSPLNLFLGFIIFVLAMMYIFKKR